MCFHYTLRKVFFYLGTFLYTYDKRFFIYIFIFFKRKIVEFLCLIKVDLAPFPQQALQLQAIAKTHLECSDRKKSTYITVSYAFFWSSISILFIYKLSLIEYPFFIWFYSVSPFFPGLLSILALKLYFSYSSSYIY